MAILDLMPRWTAFNSDGVQYRFKFLTLTGPLKLGALANDRC